MASVGRDYEGANLEFEPELLRLGGDSSSGIHEHRDLQGDFQRSRLS